MPGPGPHEIVYVGLGSNLGRRRRNLLAAAAALRRAGVVVCRASSLYESAYVGPGQAQPPYLNAVLEVTTSRSPLQLLELTQGIERRMGRSPVTHMQPRPLDVDLLFHGDVTCAGERLTLPHPRLAERRFVLEPLHELGVLDRPQHRALRQQLQVLRRTQEVIRLAPWGHGKGSHGIRT